MMKSFLSIHSFHVLDYSPWPLFFSMSLMSFFVSFIAFFSMLDYYVLFLSVLVMLMNMINWFMDISLEGSFKGCHTVDVMNNMNIGYILFILSEVFLFVSFFWSYICCSFITDIELGCNWPPFGITTFSFMAIPFLNTIILLCSGFTLTLSHHYLMNNNFKSSMYFMMLTIFLGLYFFFIQLYEYYESLFNITDCVYGSLFFFMTGFHGMHVFVGVIFLMVSLFRMNCFYYSSSHHKNFEFSSWYWHFVDVVWLFLYLVLYVWGS
uniref:Cytochrome c oxidase subunit 3 n=1 Tax=Polyascus gregaria TaxID=238043 RepID=H8ZWN3_9CRUS|nr:cytochrome oxidase subunit III [Polyascus gregaria]